MFDCIIQSRFSANGAIVYMNECLTNLISNNFEFIYVKRVNIRLRPVAYVFPLYPRLTLPILRA